MQPILTFLNEIQISESHIFRLPVSIGIGRYCRQMKTCEARHDLLELLTLQ